MQSLLVAKTRHVSSGTSAHYIALVYSFPPMALKVRKTPCTLWLPGGFTSTWRNGESSLNRRSAHRHAALPRARRVSTSTSSSVMNFS